MFSTTPPSWFPTASPLAQGRLEVCADFLVEKHGFVQAPLCKGSCLR